MKPSENLERLDSRLRRNGGAGKGRRALVKRRSFSGSIFILPSSGTVLPAAQFLRVSHGMNGGKNSRGGFVSLG
ncbi:MAG: hypothetical protein LBU43_04460 [Candidatus Accumulibacter sp.]|jgi:hypothetical protein|nr:hypothetical protein [Accumulibacter sp.]